MGYTKSEEVGIGWIEKIREDQIKQEKAEEKPMKKDDGTHKLRGGGELVLNQIKQKNRVLKTKTLLINHP